MCAGGGGCFFVWCVGSVSARLVEDGGGSPHPVRFAHGAPAASGYGICDASSR